MEGCSTESCWQSVRAAPGTLECPALQAALLGKLRRQLGSALPVFEASDGALQLRGCARIGKTQRVRNCVNADRHTALDFRSVQQLTQY